MSKRAHDGRIPEEGDTGERDSAGGRVFREREPITLLRNGKLLAGYIQTNLKVWKMLLYGLVALASGVTATVVILDQIAKPKVQSIAREEAAVVGKQLVTYQEHNERHLEQLATEARAVHSDMVTRKEFVEALSIRQKQVDEMAAQIRFLYESEIRRSRGGG